MLSLALVSHFRERASGGVGLGDQVVTGGEDASSCDARRDVGSCDKPIFRRRRQRSDPDPSPTSILIAD